MHFSASSQWSKICFGYQGIIFNRKKVLNFSQIESVSLTDSSKFFFIFDAFPNSINQHKKATININLHLILNGLSENWKKWDVQGDPEKRLFSNLCSTWGSRMIHRVEYQSKTFPNIVFLIEHSILTWNCVTVVFVVSLGLGVMAFKCGYQVWLPKRNSKKWSQRLIECSE